MRTPGGHDPAVYARFRKNIRQIWWLFAIGAVGVVMATLSLAALPTIFTTTMLAVTISVYALILHLAWADAQDDESDEES